MKISVESALTPVALCGVICRIVWQMSPGRQNGWDGGGRDGWPGFKTGGGYSFWTMWMLLSLIFAIVAVVHARDTAIFIWSLSAAFCAVSMWLRLVGSLFVDRRLQLMAVWYNSWILPDWKAEIRSLMVGWIVLLFCAVVVGARISISKWSSSHQNGDVVSLVVESVAYIVDRLRRMAACKSWKFDLLRFRCRRCLRQVLP